MLHIRKQGVLKPLVLLRKGSFLVLTVSLIAFAAQHTFCPLPPHTPAGWGTELIVPSGLNVDNSYKLAASLANI